MGQNTDVGDVYWSSPRTSIIGDKHGDHWRPAAVAVDRGVSVTLIPRTTKRRPKRERVLESPANPQIGLDEPGWWMERYTRSAAPSEQLQDARLFRFTGRLSPDEAAAVERFWKVTESIGPLR